MIRLAARLPCLAALLALSLASLANAQALPGAGEDSALPIEVSADQGIEWHQNEKAYVARGNASAKRGDTTVTADVLTAFYRELPTGGTEIWRFSAEGKVRVTTPTQMVEGDRAVYDIDRKVAVVTGRSLKLTTPTDIVTARDSLEYWEDQSIAVARGDAVATRKDQKLRADVLTALFTREAAGSQRMTRIDAKGGVVITTATDVARGREGIYDLDKQIALLSGDVRLTRGKSQLNGQRAEVDLKTGVSRLLGSGDAGGTGGRVHGLFVPGAKPGSGTGR